MSGDTSLGVVRARVLEARDALASAREVLWAAGGADLGAVLQELDALSMACEAAKVAVVGEALSRGELGSSAATATPVQWVRQHAPSTLAGGARALVDLAAAFGKAVNAPVAEAVHTGRLPLRSAAVVVAEADRMRPVLVPGSDPHVLAGLIDLAVAGGPRECRRLRPSMLAQHGLAGQLQAEQDSATAFVLLSQPFDTGTGVHEYRLHLDTEGKTVLEAALGPLSAPRPVDGAPDLRCADRRRADALMTLVRRAVSAPGDAPTTAKAQLFVTIDYAQLRDAAGAGTTTGGVDAGTVLAPETVRRIACDAAVLPVVLGGHSEVLDWGHSRRLFSAAQAKRLWLRDGGCSFPQCTVPAQWTDAHHLVHWADGGPTDLGNAALLCGHHHTVVHQRRYAGSVVTSRDDDGRLTETVVWDRTPGSYDTLLSALEVRRRA